MINSLNTELPEYIETYGQIRPYSGPFAAPPPQFKAAARTSSSMPGKSKALDSIEEAIERAGLRDGMTVSFHHHMRNGDKVVNMVMSAIAAKGIKDIHLAASGIFACHEPLVELMERGVITRVTTSTFNPGPVAKAITAGKLKYPAVLMTHGGRPRAIESGELHIDVAFISSPTCDRMGNINGTHGKSACGYLSYAYADAEYADTVVAVTDNLVEYPACPIEISQEKVDYVVAVGSIGDPGGIVSGTVKITTDPVRLGIAANTSMLIEDSGYLRQGMSFQTGASSTSLAVAAKVRERMLELGVRGSFGVGGIHAYFVRMLEEGLFENLLDTQCFDLDAVRSAAENPRHMNMSASMYANPWNKGCVVNNLDVVILGATEIDVDFNVNVITGSDGAILGASGGHSDCAAGSKLTIVVSNLIKKTRGLVKERVTTITTPGETIDALVTEYGIAINPRRTDLIERLRGSSLPLIGIRELRAKSIELGALDDNTEFTDRIIGVVEYRDGTVLDLVYQPVK